jgi:hypothetical protein
MILLNGYKNSYLELIKVNYVVWYDVFNRDTRH